MWVSPVSFCNANANHSLYNVHAGQSGFSINGGSRSGGYIGQSMAMSKSGTPFYGVYAKGYGGCCSTYKQSDPLLNMNLAKSAVRGIQPYYVKPSVVSTYGMLQHRYPNLFHGKYPCYWVQPNYPNGSLSDNSSQGAYIIDLWRKGVTQWDINEEDKFQNNILCLCPTDWWKSSFHVNNPGRGYFKQTRYTLDSSEQIYRILQKCTLAQDCIGPMKPFPFATTSPADATSNMATGAPGSCNNCTTVATPRVTYLTPPAWYLRTPASLLANLPASS